MERKERDYHGLQGQQANRLVCPLTSLINIADRNGALQEHEIER